MPEELTGKGGITTDATILYDRLLEYVETIIVEGVEGPPGPEGPQGPPGIADAFIYDRLGVAASTWIIIHNKGRLSSVSIILDSGEEVQADVEHSSDFNITTISFPSPHSGKAVVI